MDFGSRFGVLDSLDHFGGKRTGSGSLWAFVTFGVSKSGLNPN